MDALTFTMNYAMIILSLCGMTYLLKQAFLFMRWMVRYMKED